MKLEIDLADRNEVAAAVPLLQLILDNTTASAPAPLAPTAAAAPSFAAAAPSPIAPEATPGATSTTIAPTVPVVPAPNPAPVALAPSAPVTLTSPVGVAGLELDSQGLPWDERIHASTKSKVADGSWKAKRGINDPALVKRIEEELRARMNSAAIPAGAPLVVSGAPQLLAGSLEPTGGSYVVSQPEAPPAMDAAAVFGAHPAQAPAPGVPAAPFVPPAAPSLPAAPGAPLVFADPTTFEQMMTLISPLVVAGKLPPTATNQAATANGLANIVALQTAPQFVPLVWATIKQMHPTAFV